MQVAWGDRSTWDAAAVPVFSERVDARATARLYGSFAFRELPAIGAGSFEGKRLAVPTRLIVGARDRLGAHLALGLEHHGDDAASEILEGVGHFVPEERPVEVAARARELFGAAA
jgi:pimeloyl-ACP methyl ester carboxylesterase